MLQKQLKTSVLRTLNSLNLFFLKLEAKKSFKKNITMRLDITSNTKYFENKIFFLGGMRKNAEHHTS